MKNFLPFKIILLPFLLLLIGLGELIGLDSRYERNGEVYMLVGEGPKRGVYDFRNHKDSITAKLYDSGDAYGLSVDLDRNLFTFAATDNNVWTLVTSPLERMVARPDGYPGAPGRTVTTCYTMYHAYYDGPNLGDMLETFHGWGSGKHTSTNVKYNDKGYIGYHFSSADGATGSSYAGYPWNFAGDLTRDYPCHWQPDPIPSKGPLWFKVDSGKWYHSFETAPNPGYGLYRHDTGKLEPRPLLLRESVERKTRTLNLFKYPVDSSGPLTNKGNVATVTLAEKRKITRLAECGDPCYPGAGTSEAPGGMTPFVDVLVSGFGRNYFYSRVPDSTSYILDVNQSGYGGGVIGDPANVGTAANNYLEGTRFIGVSSKTSSEDWVYSLGSNVIRNWMKTAGRPDWNSVNITSVAVSDQWYQTGGIIYAYDRAASKIIKIQRDETSGSISKITDIPYVIEEADAVKADGFGNIYYAVTDKVPAKVDDFKNTDYESRTLRKVTERYYWDNIYAQEVSKKAFSIEFIGGSKSEAGRLVLGLNKFRRSYELPPKTVETTVDFLQGNGGPINVGYISKDSFVSSISIEPITPFDGSGNTISVGTGANPLQYIDKGNPNQPKLADKLGVEYTTSGLNVQASLNSPTATKGKLKVILKYADGDPKSLIPVTGFIPLNVPIETDYRTELAVINVATPPQVTGEKQAKVDISGPYIIDASNQIVPHTGTIEAYKLYFLQAENFPVFDEAGRVNVRATNLSDTPASLQFGANGFVGGYVSTLKKDTLQYHWKILKTKDRYGSAVTPNETVYDRTSTSPQLPIFLAEGTYNIYLGVQYRYYNYDSLPYGALSDTQSSVVTPATSLPPMKGKSIDGTEWARVTISIDTISSAGAPTGPGRITLNNFNTPSANRLAGADPQPSFVIPEEPGTGYVFRLRDRSENWDSDDSAVPPVNKDRIDMMLAINPPDPQDPRMIAGSLKWADSGVAFTWISNLVNPQTDQVLVDQQVVTDLPELKMNQNSPSAGQASWFKVPSDPVAYKVSCKAYRLYQYETYIEMKIGDQTFTTTTTITVPIEIDGSTKVLVTDNTPPALAGFKTTTPVLYGVTGKKLSETSAFGKTNPTTLEFLMEDNNPMGNLTLSPEVTNSPNVTGSNPNIHLAKSNNANKQIWLSYQSFLNNAKTVANDGVKSLYTATGNSSSNGFSFSVPTSAELSSFGVTPTVPNLTSYYKYSYSVSSLKHFSTGPDGSVLPFEWATNRSGYSNFDYGIAFKDTSSNVNMNGVNPAYLSLGQIVVVDRTLPNIFVRALSDKNPGNLFVIPTNLNNNALGNWMNINDTLTWTGNSLPFPGAVKANVAAAVVARIPENLDEDVPAQFEWIPLDNVALINDMKLTSWKSYKSDGSEFKAYVSAPVPVNSRRTKFRDIFTEPGLYSMRITIEDSALDWPSDYKTPTNANPLPNTRTLDFAVPVSRSVLQIRVLESQKQ